MVGRRWGYTCYSKYEDKVGCEHTWYVLEEAVDCRNLCVCCVQVNFMYACVLCVGSIYLSARSTDILFHSFPSFPSPPSSPSPPMAIPSIAVGVRASSTPTPSPKHPFPPYPNASTRPSAVITKE